MQNPIIFSFFSGAGFLDLGFETSNFKKAYVNELHKPFLDSYIYSRQCLNTSEPIFGYDNSDISKFIEFKHYQDLKTMVKKGRQISDMVGFIGGPPCPDFSVGGKNRGKEGDNGKLSAIYIEIICQQKPDFFVFENVKGLWRTYKHRAFYEEMKQKLHDNGYITTERLINAIEYGVPQDRARIILIGFRRNLLEDLNFLPHNDVITEISESSFPWKNHTKYSINQIASIPWPKTRPFQEDSCIPCPEGIPQELTVEYWFRKNDINNHPNSQQHFSPRAGIKRFLTVDEGDDSKKSYKRLHRWRYSPTACYGNNEVHLHPYKVRRLSVSETLAIQSLPKSFSLPPDLSLTNSFKTVGNGVPYLASLGIAKTILDFLR